MHLYTASFDDSAHFHGDVPGFREGTLAPAMQSGDVGLDSRPHIAAFNVWQREIAPPSPPGSLGLRYSATVLLAETAMSDVIARVQSAGFAVRETPEGIFVDDLSENRILLRRG